MFFVVGFVSIVLVTLTGYRYSVDTRANDRYLYHVANHTTWLLGLIGEKAELENNREMLGEPREVRASLIAWDDGREHPSTDDFEAAGAAPLTAWEAWSYKAYKAREKTPHREYGPRVEFMLRRGTAADVRDLEAELNRVRRDESMDRIERAEELERITAELRPLRDALNESRRTVDSEDPNPTYDFVFIVVSECGAIEVMAIFFAAVVAFPTRWWKRLVGIAAGLPVMYLVNILRLSCLAVIGAYDAAMFKFAHEYLWQAVYIIFVVVVWMLWVEFVVRESRSEQPAAEPPAPETTPPPAEEESA